MASTSVMLTDSGEVDVIIPSNEAINLDLSVLLRVPSTWDSDRGTGTKGYVNTFFSETNK